MVVFTIFTLVISTTIFVTGFVLGYYRGRISVLEDQLQEWENQLKRLGNNNESS